MALFGKKKDASPAPSLEDIVLPVHVGIIMDGNGRWAKKRGLPRKLGHREGAQVFRTITRYCSKIGIKYLTVYAFSTENWKRPEDEIVRAVKNISEEVREGKLDAGSIDAQTISDHLYTAGQPDPDLIIRPSGEYRISNFMLWQSAYTEFVIMNKLWPDFRTADLDEALQIYSQRNRRYGGV